MKKIVFMCSFLILLSGCMPMPQEEEVTPTPGDAVVTPSNANDLNSTVPIVPKDLVSKYEPKGFSDGEAEKAVVVIADPREDSLVYDLAVATMRYLEAKGMEVEKRDLYQLDFNPALREDDIRYVMDGTGTADLSIKDEQKVISQADHIIFVSSTILADETAMLKGYKQKVFSNTFAYKVDGDDIIGLLSDKTVFTILNGTNLGSGTDTINDREIKDYVNEKWTFTVEYFRSLDEQMVNNWGVDVKGRFVNDNNPANDSKTYKEELEMLHTELVKVLDETYFAK